MFCASTVDLAAGAIIPMAILKPDISMVTLGYSVLCIVEVSLCTIKFLMPSSWIPSACQAISYSLDSCWIACAAVWGRWDLPHERGPLHLLPWICRQCLRSMRVWLHLLQRQMPPSHSHIHSSAHGRHQPTCPS